MSDLALSTQKERLETAFLDWKKDEPQSDDVIVMGFEV
jgi:hypothetical protein